jgi:murein DD-endopeptidase MepM/ murein hydrolase activator NlpD
LSAALPAAQAQEQTEHVVASGDTLSGIASRTGVPASRIAEANGLEPPYVIKVGQKLLIPRQRRHIVGKDETSFTIAYLYAVPWRKIAQANDIPPDASLRIGQELLIPATFDLVKLDPQPASSRFAWPLSGPIRRGFAARGRGNYHDGLDITAARGAAVRAAAAGTVIFAGREENQFGNLVVIEHGDGWHTAYGSLSTVTVKEGGKVRQGERIGLVGDTSVTRRTELHFELRKDGTPVDPLPDLPRPE